MYQYNPDTETSQFYHSIQETIKKQKPPAQDSKKAIHDLISPLSKQIIVNIFYQTLPTTLKRHSGELLSAGKAGPDSLGNICVAYNERRNACLIEAHRLNISLNEFPDGVRQDDISEIAKAATDNPKHVILSDRRLKLTTR